MIALGALITQSNRSRVISNRGKATVRDPTTMSATTQQKGIPNGPKPLKIPRQHKWLCHLT